MNRYRFVDGHYFLYRSFFAIRGLRDSQGRPTNAIFGFIKALRKMIADVSPTHGAVFWDCGLPGRRTALQPDYKQQRPPMPDDLRAQEERVVAVCPLLGLASLSVPGTEADDLIASYAHRVAGEGEVVIATADKDILQLSSDRVLFYSTAKPDLENAGNPPGAFTLLAPGQIESKWGVPPGSIRDVLALMGDASDNIPGVPGIGEKTALGLIREFGSLSNLLARSAEVPNAKLREKIGSAKAQILSNWEMVRLDQDLPLPVEPSSLTLKPDPAAYLDFLRECEFHSLLAREEDATAPAPGPQAVQGELFG